MKPLVIGASGFIGQALLQHLDNPVVAGRNLNKLKSLFPSLEARQWDTFSAPNPEFFKDIDVVFHLAGESVAGKRWNSEIKKRIYESRVVSTRSLVKAIAALKEKPSTLVCASAVGYYGDRGREELKESSPAGSGFLADVCLDWEAAAQEAEKHGVRVVCVRIPVVLGNGGGALEQMVPLFKMGLGGRLSSGRQFMPWIHLDDLAKTFLFAAEQPDISGPLNAVAPQIIDNNEFTKALASSLKRWAIFPAPGFMLKLILGEFASVLLASQRVIPRVLQRAGFEYGYPNLEEALSDLLAK
jgi:uncharacterized protein (TIGR01777 family)